MSQFIFRMKNSAIILKINQNEKKTLLVMMEQKVVKIQNYINIPYANFLHDFFINEKHVN